MSQLAILKVFFIISMILQSGCTYIELKSSPAPGCIVSLGPMIGGCHGKSAIVDLKTHVEPQLDCLSFSVNNCNGGIINIENSCGHALNFEDISIPPDSINPTGETSLDLIQVGKKVKLTSAKRGNFSQHITKKNLHLNYVGHLNHSEVRLSFVKTKPLCD